VKKKEQFQLFLKGLIIIYFFYNSRQIVMYLSVHTYYTLFVYFSIMQFNMDMHLSLCIIFMNFRIMLQKLTVFSHKTSHFQYICKEANITILNSLNNCLQDILELTPTINLINFFYIPKILIFNSPPFPPPPPPE
jgi:hypothetical protein